ncbi:MAG: NADP-dependent isocitrate dehydrogenase [Candidatus Azotimanducaceae bacterium WSBS_2022_MAG_OTU7]
MALAPKHVQQIEKEGHLRRDSMGEFRHWALRLSTWRFIQQPAGSNWLTP